MAQVVNCYVTDFGTVILPDDFPMHAMRKNGAPDKRFKIAHDAARYEEDLKEAAEISWLAGWDIHGQRAMGFGEWLKS